jgi:hypothetical protein
VVSPFLPKPGLVTQTLRYLGLPAVACVEQARDAVADEIMISPAQFAAQDAPYTHRLADWTHDRGGLFWYHNCGQTRELIRRGHFDRLGADVIETVAPPPEGDNDLGESRRYLSPATCSKGNLSLGLLRDGSVEDVTEATRHMVRAVQGYAHIHSTADAVYAETPPENFVAFIRTAREEAERLA